MIQFSFQMTRKFIHNIIFNAKIFELHFFRNYLLLYYLLSLLLLYLTIIYFFTIKDSYIQVFSYETIN